MKSQAIEPKADMTSRTQSFDCKAEVTEVIEKVNSKNSGLKNPRWRRRIKKNNDVSNNSRYRFAANKHVIWNGWG